MTEQEEMALRELAAKPHYLPQVSAALGPLSLWSKAGIEAEIRRAVEAEREECAKLCDKFGKESASHWPLRFANMIRARSNT